MFIKIFLLLSFTVVYGAPNFYPCPSVTTSMASSCVTDDPKCSAVPIKTNGCFQGCEIVCSDSENPARCDSPSQIDIERCDNFGDPLCSAFADITEENGRKCFRTCGLVCI
uniref:Uncharacterized protein LOC111138244 n=1 Tax=Crassostrea virginica TaxID=6565 RepID=A0A8B8F1Y4_CRAVI|nr:uncharacterized protein LOC111138244 [Crassostrea virginica]